MKIAENLFIERAEKEDLQELLRLYFSIYGNNYPLKIGLDSIFSKVALEDVDNYLWLVVRDGKNVTKDSPKGVIAGSCVFELDRKYAIGKVSGVVVNRAYQKRGIASELIAYGKTKILMEDQEINTLYTTTRTLTVAPQLMFLKNGFLPLGIFPNAHKINRYETLTLLGAFRSGILNKRLKVVKVPLKILPIVNLVNDLIKKNIPEIKIDETFSPEGVNHTQHLEQVKNLLAGERDIQNEIMPKQTDFEFIMAENFVQRRFAEIFKNDMESTFYPFHEPNLLITHRLSGMEIYTTYNEKDHYCVIIASTAPISQFADNFRKLIYAMKDYGISYIELLVRIDRFKALCFFLDNEFIPSAVYPAMREIDGQMNDYILLTRTMEPLDFRGINIHQSFGPFIKQYTNQWINMHIDSMEVYKE